MVLKNHQKGFFRSKITRPIELQSNGVDDFAICPTIDPELEEKNWIRTRTFGDTT